MIKSLDLNKGFRYEVLDSLRGIPALSVILVDLANLSFDIPGLTQLSIDIVKIIQISPVGIFFSANQAVLLFFVLSGFVVTLMLENGTNY